MRKAMGRGRAGAVIAGVAVGAISVLAPTSARAHFILQAPACYSQQDAIGIPEKSAPCGQSDTGSTVVPTGMVTAFQPGQTVTITITEAIYHPGHYRVALAGSQADLPADPTVTAGSSACGTAVIENPATLPVLADDLLDHSSAFSGPQSVQVKLPDNPPCTQCVLQVVEFMSDHPLNPQGGCFYHHCANITIESVGDGGSSGDASPAGAGGSDATSGCGCATSGHAAPAMECLGGIAVFLAMARRRRQP
jgi:hypothetical protein